MADTARKYQLHHQNGGRKDVEGVVWFACDPYPSWYRYENGDLITKWQPDFGPNDGLRKRPLGDLGTLTFHRAPAVIDDPWAVPAAEEEK